jgi:hypothetical protein
MDKSLKLQSNQSTKKNATPSKEEIKSQDTEMKD